MAVNIALLDKIMDRVEANLDKWNQGQWAGLHVNGYSIEQLLQFVAEDPDNPACGTAMCFAGHTVVDQGWRVLYEIRRDGYSGEIEAFANECTKRGAHRVWDIEEKARQLLGLSFTDGERLFSASNTIEDLRNAVEHLKEHGSLDSFGW